MSNLPSLREVVGRHASAAQTAPEMAAVALREAIVTGALQGGATIKQDDVAQLLQISKAPIREALRELQADGLVQAVKNRGFIVTRMSAAEMDEMFRIRSALEPIAIELAMPMMTSRDIEKAAAFIDKMENLSDLSWMCDFNLNFHLSLYAPSEASHLLKMIRHAHYVSHRYVHASYWAGHSAPASQDEHKAILEACRRRDVVQAGALLSGHIQNAWQTMRSDLARFFVGHGVVPEFQTEGGSRAAARR
ncbi:GntR family transcriptional regulator [Shinella pollutisoli]|uniref:GntR family transcriptional regulator n=1 Tax=Shinella pollutisoli TaxID=2250594 RepID=A0ABV7DH23_9HYPH|nr:GntR family transcriptional regulator [Shinella pollutisoli]